MFEFEGKVAVVTGGASGLGLAIAEALGREGMKLFLADINQADLDSARGHLAKQGLIVESIVCDVADRKQVVKAAEHAAARLGKIHLVVNNAGVGAGGPLAQFPEEDWTWLLGVNLSGVVNGMEVFTPLIRSHGEGGHFINIASLAGLIVPPQMVHYAATKFAVVALSEGWNDELRTDGIGVSVVCPSVIKTRIHLSDRNRPQDLRAKTDAMGANVTSEAMAKVMEGGINPDEAARRIIRGVKRGETHIITHPETKGAIAGRFQRILEAFERAEQLDNC